MQYDNTLGPQTLWILSIEKVWYKYRKCQDILSSNFGKKSIGFWILIEDKLRRIRKIDFVQLEFNVKYIKIDSILNEKIIELAGDCGNRSPTFCLILEISMIN